MMNPTQYGTMVAIGDVRPTAHQEHGKGMPPSNPLGHVGTCLLAFNTDRLYVFIYFK